ncbi:hypothetical protein ACQ4PT_071269 [Festuca glaucescens]
MDQQRFVDVKSGQSWSSDSVLKDGQRVCLTSVSLVNPASAAGQGVVVACVKGNACNLPIGHLSASSAAWELLPELVLDGEFFLYVNQLEDRDSAPVDVRFDFYVLPPPVPETLDQQLSRQPWSVDLAIGLTHRAFMKGRDRVCLTRVSLVDPGTAARQDVIGACVHTVTLDRALAQLSAERPSVDLRPGVVLEKEVYFYLMRLGCLPAAGEVVVRFEGYVLPMCLPETTEEEVENDTGEEVEVEEDYEHEEPVGSESEYDSDGSEEEDAGSMAGIMRMAAVESQEEGQDKQILVLYRYTRFWMAWDGALEARGRTKERQLRFVVPPTGDTARSLPWAGASLACLVYPGSHLRKELQELWSSLIADLSIPPRATRVEMFVDVGILRQEDCTSDSMERMYATLEGTVAQSLPEWHIGMELRLPEPVRCDHDEDEAGNDDTDGDERPAKRRRVVAGEEDCPVCLQLLEGDDLAAWPGCGKPHVFHGRCLELVLRESDMCPICRCLLHIEPEPIDE